MPTSRSGGQLLSLLIVSHIPQAARLLVEEAGLPVTIDVATPEELAATSEESQLLNHHDIAMLDLAADGWREALLNLRLRMPVIAYSVPDIKTAAEAMKLGATDCLESPLTAEAVLKCCSRHGRQALEHQHGFDEILGTSPAIREVFTLLKKAAAGESTVLITGESGTGKELAARAIHRWSPRRERAFLTINCGAIPDTLLESELFGFERGAFTGAMQLKKGILELADGGTVFFDEIGDVSTLFQTKILRVIQEGEFMRVGGQSQIHTDVRVIAATNRDLPVEIRNGRFREDLFYRLNVINIHLPPLRERKEDIPLLVHHFIRKHGPKRKDMMIRGVSDDAMAILREFSYPGNIRELENIIERAVSLTSSPDILPSDLPHSLQAITPQRRLRLPRLREALARTEREIILAALNEAGGNITRAASLLGIYRQQLQKKIKTLHLDLRQAAS